MSGAAFVTGATGGLGRVLVERLLAQGRAVTALGRNRAVGALLERQGARFVAADLCDPAAAIPLEGADTLFHLAALSAPWGPESAFHAANVEATLRLLERARAAGVKRFVHVSTPSIYARPRDQIGLSEGSPLPPHLATAYARTKLVGERAVLAAHDGAMHTVALRPRAIIAPHDTALLPRLLRAADKGAMPLPRGGRALVEPTDARDVVDALFAAENRSADAGGRAFNVSGGTPVQLRDLVGEVFAALGKPVRLIPLPAHLVLGAGALMEQLARREPVLTRYAALTLGWSQTFDLSAARDVLGWSPRHHPFAALRWALAERTRETGHA